MSDPKQGMKIQKSHGNSHNALKTAKRLEELSAKVESLKAERDAQLSAIDSNKHYSVLFWIGGGLVLVNAILCPNVFGFLLLAIFAAIYVAYKKLTDKEAIKSATTAEFKEKIEATEAEISRLKKEGQ